MRNLPGRPGGGGYTGSVWTPVVAIRRRTRSGWATTTRESWRQLVCACAPEIARGYKIPLEHLRWYAAFHRKEDSVHIHMVVFSSNPGRATSPDRASNR